MFGFITDAIADTIGNTIGKTIRVVDKAAQGEIAVKEITELAVDAALTAVAVDLIIGDED